MSISQLSSMTCFTKASGNFALLKTAFFLLQLHDFGLGVTGLAKTTVFVCLPATGVIGIVNSCIPSFM